MKQAGSDRSIVFNFSYSSRLYEVSGKITFITLKQLMILQLILWLRLCASKHTKNVLPCSLTDFTESGRRFWVKLSMIFPFRRGRCPACVFKRRDRRDRRDRVVRSKRFRFFLRLL